MTAVYITAAVLLPIIAVALLLLPKRRTVVDNCVIWVSQTTRPSSVYIVSGTSTYRNVERSCGPPTSAPKRMIPKR